MFRQTFNIQWPIDVLFSFYVIFFIIFLATELS